MMIFLYYKSEKVLNNLDDYSKLSISNNNINNSLNDDFKVVNDKMYDVYDVDQYKKSKLLNLNEWFDVDSSFDNTSLGSLYGSLSNNFEFNFCI